MTTEEKVTKKLRQQLKSAHTRQGPIYQQQQGHSDDKAYELDHRHGGVLSNVIAAITMPFMPVVLLLGLAWPNYDAALPAPREEELLQHVADLKAELEGTAAQNSQQHADIHELTTAVEALEAHAEALEQRATEAEAAHAAEVGHSTVLQQQQLQELRAAKQEQQEVLKQQQTLLDSLAQRDQQVSYNCIINAMPDIAASAYPAGKTSFTMCVMPA